VMWKVEKRRREKKKELSRKKKKKKIAQISNTVTQVNTNRRKK
jgi:hypothetical protein